MFHLFNKSINTCRTCYSPSNSFSSRLLTSLKHQRAFPNARKYPLKNPAKESTKELVFDSPSGGPIRMVKRFSIVTTGLGLVAVPLFWTIWDLSIVQNSGLRFSTVILTSCVSIGSTLFLHWFFSPYVSKLFLHHSETAFKENTRGDAKEGSLEASRIPRKPIENQLMTPSTQVTFETTGFTGRKVLTTVKLSDLIVGKGLRSTWEIDPEKMMPMPSKGFACSEPKEYENSFPQTKFWLDLPKKPYQGAFTLYKIDQFLKEWAPQTIESKLKLRKFSL